MNRGNTDLAPLRAEQVEAVLRRAAELDSRRASSLTIHELRSVAVEAGITASSLDAAINELQSGPTAEPQARMPWLITASTAVASVSYVIWWARAIAADGITTSDVVGLIAGSTGVAATVFGLSVFAFGAAKKVRRHVRAYITGLASAQGD